MRNYIIIISCLLLSCSDKTIDLSNQTTAAANKLVENYSTKFNKEIINLYPQSLTTIGIYSKDDQLNDLSEAIIQRLVNLSSNSLRELKKNVNLLKLDSIHQNQFEDLETKHNDFMHLNTYWYNRYSVNPLNGEHISVIDFLLNQHRLNTKIDVFNYVQRVIDMKRKYRSLLKRTQIQFEKGLFAPSFLIKSVINQLDSILAIEPTQQMIYKHLESAIESIDEVEDKEKVLSDLAFYIESNMLNRLRRWRVFLVTDYITSALQSGSILEQKNGDQYYQDLARFYQSDTVINSFNISDLKRFKIRAEVMTFLSGFSDTDPSNYYIKMAPKMKKNLISLIPTEEIQTYRTLFSWLHWLDIRLHQEKEPIEQIKSELVKSKLFSSSESEQVLLVMVCYPAYFSQFPAILYR